MKKLLAVVLAVVLVMALSLTALAAPQGFVSSPSGTAAPEILEFSNSDEDCISKLTITPYGERNKLDEAGRKLMEDAYNKIINSSNLGELNKNLENLAKQLGITVNDLAVSDLFDISSKDCVSHDEHGEFTIKLKDEDLKNFAGLMRYDGTHWHLVEGAKISADGTHLTFTSKEIGTFAIVTKTGSSTVSPPTGDNMSWVYYVVIAVVVAAMGVAFVAYKTKKRA